MRSGTSYFNGTVFKKTILRFWPVWAAYSVIWFVALPLNALMMLRRGAQWGIHYLKDFAQYTVPGMHNASLTFAVGFGALAAMAVCSHLYNARSANFFGSLPVRREGMFLTHYLAGLSFLIVPNAVVFLLTLLIEVLGSAVFLPELLFWLGVACGECLFFYSMAVFVGMFTGHILALPAFYAIFNALAAVLYYLMNWVFQSFYYGFAFDYESRATELITWLTPVMKLGETVWSHSYFLPTGGIDSTVSDGGRVLETHGLGTVGIYAIAAVALTAGAFFLYRFRRMESAGDVVSVKCMRPVFKYSVAVCAGLCFGMLTAQIVYFREPGLMVSMLVWAVIGYFVAQMLLDKTFKVFGKWKGAAAVAAVFVLMFLVVGFDLTGYETRIPTADQVASVEFSGAHLHNLGDGGDYLDTVQEDPDFIQLAILLHQAAVDQRDGYSFNGERSTYLDLVYHLKNGSTLTRQYTLWVDTSQVDREGSAAWAIQQIYDNRDLYWEAYGFEEAERRMAEEGYRLEQAWFSNDGHDPAVDQTLYYYGREAKSLYEAVKEDFQAGRIGVRHVGDGDNWRDFQRDLQFRFVNSNGTMHWVEIYVQDTASSTLSVLNRLAAGDLDGQAPYTVWTDGEVGREPVP